MNSVSETAHHINKKLKQEAQQLVTVRPLTVLQFCSLTVEMGRMSDYTIRPKPNSWPSSPNEAEYSAG